MITPFTFLLWVLAIAVAFLLAALAIGIAIIIIRSALSTSVGKRRGAAE